MADNRLFKDPNIEFLLRVLRTKQSIVLLKGKGAEFDYKPPACK